MLLAKHLLLRPQIFNPRPGPKAKRLLPTPRFRPQIFTPGRGLALGPKICCPGRKQGRRFSPQATTKSFGQRFAAKAADFYPRPRPSLWDSHLLAKPQIFTLGRDFVNDLLPRPQILAQGRRLMT